MSLLGFTLRVRQTGKAKLSMLLDDLEDGTDGPQGGFLKAGPVYVPQVDDGYIDLAFTASVQKSHKSGAICKFTGAGYLTSEFVLSKEIQKAATKFLDSKQSVRLGTAGDIALSGLQSLDGILLRVGDRVLVKNQTEASENGLYISSAGVWERSDDADEDFEVTAALNVFVEEGNLLADSYWELATDNPITIGETGLDFQQVSTGGGGGGGTTRRAYQFGRGVKVPSSGTLFLNSGGVPTSAAPLVINAKGTLTGASLRVGSVDGSRSYALQIRVNGFTVESLSLPLNVLSVFSSAFTSNVEAGDEISILLFRAAGSGPSAFRNISVSVELAES